MKWEEMLLETRHALGSIDSLTTSTYFNNINFAFTVLLNSVLLHGVGRKVYRPKLEMVARKLAFIFKVSRMVSTVRPDSKVLYVRDMGLFSVGSSNGEEILCVVQDNPGLIYIRDPPVDLIRLAEAPSQVRATHQANRGRRSGSTQNLLSPLQKVPQVACQASRSPPSASKAR